VTPADGPGSSRRPRPQPRRNTPIPGPESQVWIDRDRESESGGNAYPDFFGTGVYSPIITGAEGSEFIDADGNSFVESSGAFACSTFGYAPGEVVDAAVNQMRQLAHVPDLPTKPRIELAEKLTEIAPGELKQGRVQFDLGGAGAMDLAFKLAHFHSRATRPHSAHKVVTFAGAYHGRTMTTLQLTGSAHAQEGIPHTIDPVRMPVPYCYRCPFGKEYPSCDLACASFVRQQFESDAWGLRNPRTGHTQASIMLWEPIQAHIGMIFPPEEFMGEMRSICDDFDLTLVDDEVSYGPILLGHRHPDVEAAVAAQHACMDCGNGPAPVLVALAERLVEIVEHADWSVFAKNGSDATTLCLTLVRAHARRSTILVAEGAYHGALPWCTPTLAGVVPEYRAHLRYYRYNDLDSVRAALAGAEGDLARILVSPFRHDAGFDQELPDPEFVRGLRAICDEHSGLLILDEVRCGLRLAFGGSWDALGVRPDLSAWSKAIANGYPLAAVLGTDAVWDAAEEVFATGSFWTAADSMAAALATIDVLERDGGVAHMHRLGVELWCGLTEQLDRLELDATLSGHLTMPYLTFAGDRDRDHALGDLFAAMCAEHGVLVHPRHDWFLSAALTEGDIEQALVATERACAAVRAAVNVGDARVTQP